MDEAQAAQKTSVIRGLFLGCIFFHVCVGAGSIPRNFFLLFLCVGRLSDRVRIYHLSLSCAPFHGFLCPDNCCARLCMYGSLPVPHKICITECPTPFFRKVALWRKQKKMSLPPDRSEMIIFEGRTLSSLLTPPSLAPTQLVRHLSYRKQESRYVGRP